MIALTYDIELREPVLVTRLEGDPNANISYDYIPGSALRAALLLRLAARHGVPPAQVVEDPRTGETARRLFFGRPCFLNAYPLARDRRAMPTPLSWRQKKKERYAKGREARIYDFLAGAPDDEQYARVSSPFCWWDSSSKASLTAPEREVMVHTQRAIQNRNRGRAVLNDGQVFQYQPLACHQTLAGAILCDAQDAQVLKELLEGDHAIGGARTAGYGRVTISNVREETDWREAPGELPDHTDTFALLLTSDLLLRDAGGQYAVGKEIWLAALQARLRDLGYEGSITADDKAFIDVALVGGFNRKWGLPLPQAQALKMGSVMMARANPPAPQAVLRALEQAGLGERRVDGFGRLAVLCDAPERLEVMSDETVGPRASQHPAVALKSDEISAGIARRMAQRLLEQRLETALLAAAARVEVHAPPNRSQLSRLRNITLNILRNPTTAREGQAGQDRFTAFLESVSQRKTTREQWERARVHIEQSGKKQLFKDWLAAVYGADKLSEQDWREKTGLEMAKQQIGDDITVALDQAMRRRLGLRLIAEVLKRASKASAARGSA